MLVPDKDNPPLNVNTIEQPNHEQRECRWHGTVPYDHVCVRPGENADTATARAFGEIRDV